MHFQLPVLSFSLSALNLTFSESFVNVNYATFINFIKIKSLSMDFF